MSGFTHSAFALGYEAGINRSPIDGNLVPPGALVTFVQKGLQYLELEANLCNVSVLIDICWSFSAHVSYSILYLYILLDFILISVCLRLLG